MAHQVRQSCAMVALAILLLLPNHASAQTTLVIRNQRSVVVSGLNISTTSGDCVQIINSTNVTIQASQIGPCGTNGTANNSRGIFVKGSGGINIYDSYIHVENQASVCGDTHDGIFITGTDGPVNVQGNVIAYNEQNVRVWDASNVHIVGNFVLNPRGALTCSNPDNLPGHSIQAWADGGAGYWNSDVTISDNYLLNSGDLTKYLFVSNDSDSIAAGMTNGFKASGNYVVGGNYLNGCGVIADAGTTGAMFSDNIISNPVGCGIGLSGGAGAVVSDNKILNLTPSAPYATGITINGGQCPISITGNIASAFQGNGPNQGAWNQAYWTSGSCSAPSLSGNMFDTGCKLPNCPAYKLLYPIASTNQPPLIPPQPYACVATSPYSTQTDKPACAAASAQAP